MHFAGVYCCLNTTVALYPELFMNSTTQWASLDQPWMLFLCAGGIIPCVSYLNTILGTPQAFPHPGEDKEMNLAPLSVPELLDTAQVQPEERES